MTRLERLQRQIDRLENRLITLNQISDRFSWLRAGVALGGMSIVPPLVVLVSVPLGILWFGLVVISFAVVVNRHRRVLDTIQQFQVWQAIQANHVARLQIDWHTLPPTNFRPTIGHPFENDFDVTGQYSLHRLMDTTTTLEASQQLRDWLLITHPRRAEILERQAIVQDLSQRRLFRDKLTLYATRRPRDLQKKRELAPLLKWLEQHPPTGNMQAMLKIALGFVAVNIILFSLNMADVLPAVWQLSFVLYIGFNFSRLEVRGLFGDALQLQALMRQLSRVFSYIETYDYQDAEHLRVFSQTFQTGTTRPSILLKRLNRILAAGGLQTNPIGWMAVNALLPWDIYWAHQLNQVKVELADILPSWLDKWMELEVLSALASFADFQSHTHFPTIADETTPDAPLFVATALGHPLVHAEKRIYNDFAIQETGNIAILTGSNMAGKSTFLRTLGLNLALTYAGAPVIAEGFTTAPLRLFACIRVTDSVTDGISYFYAEVQRLKALLDEVEAEHNLPLLYLIDEIFRGTNNRERLIGSRAYIRSLIAKDGVGLIATHDLELVQLADEFDSIRNYHFRDDVSAGKMNFDYLLREGPCPTTNALKIMAIEGLPVDVE